MLTPLAADDEPPRLARVVVGGGAHAWTATFGDGGVELIVENEARRTLELDGVRTDVRLLWLRRAPDGHAAELLAIGEGAVRVDGQVDGQDVVCGGPAGWTAGAWHDGHFMAES
jgi:hypothetical protein